MFLLCYNQIKQRYVYSCISYRFLNKPRGFNMKGQCYEVIKKILSIGKLRSLEIYSKLLQNIILFSVYNIIVVLC